VLPCAAIACAALPAAAQNGLTPKELLGRTLFFDASLSSPVGQSCASCHAPEAGFKFPSSHINREFGVATGAIQSRFGSRAVPTISYASFIPRGPVAQPRPIATDGGEMLFVGGVFWDGHAEGLEEQAHLPFFHPNEMNNIVRNLPSPELLASKVAASPEADLFREVYGSSVFSGPAAVVLDDVADAIAAYERTPQVSPFTSRYDAYVAGTGTLTDAELDGLRLMTGTWSGRPGGTPYRKDAQCVLCHGISQDPSIGYPDLWTNFCYANIGVPKNRKNPFYRQTSSHSNLLGYNPEGKDFIDLGLGGVIYPAMGLPSGNLGPGSSGKGDFLIINGAFKAPTLRDVDKRPHQGFVKAYMHNGSFKDLKDIVHFYNTRNLTTWPGEIIDFTLPHPYANLRGRPLWPEPEVASPDSLTNPQGLTPEEGGQVGNLGLTDEEEDHIVAFLKALTDH
jgi:cytochrome c peroxidase